MIHVWSRRVFLFAVCAAAAIGCAAAADAPFYDLRNQPPMHGDAVRGAGKIAACAACHGPRGVAVAPTFPNLAGQSATYLYVQLRAFKDGSRDNAVMKPMASALSDQDMRDVAGYYASQPGKTGSVGDPSSRGYAMFHEGDPAKGIPPCQGCHGSDGRGPRPSTAGVAPQPAWSTFPTLAGQNAPYVRAQLKAFHDGTRVGTSNDRIMQGVAHNLEEQDMQALAAYLASQ